MKTIDQYNLETLQKAIDKNRTIKFIEHKTKRDHAYWYSVEIYDNDKLISGYGAGELTNAINLAKMYAFVTKEII
jgi:hypothetical protein